MGDDEPQPKRRCEVDYDAEDTEAFPCSLTDVIEFSRADVYRQRIFGCESGREAFVTVDNKRRDTCVGFLFYVLFLYFFVTFIGSRFDIGTAFDIKQAITTELNGIPFQTEPVRKVWKDAHSPADVNAWLRNAFPTFIAARVQEARIPVTDVRLTFQHINSMDAPFDRFAALAPTVWVDQLDLVQEEEIEEESLNQSSFGAYREWVGHELSWNQANNSRCNGFEIDMLEFPRTEVNTLEKVVGQCKAWCEELQSPSTCRCWTLENAYTCRFYSTNIADLQESDTVGRCGYIADVAASALTEMRFPSCSSDITTAYWPTMKQFVFEESLTSGIRPGHVVNLSLDAVSNVNDSMGTGMSKATAVAYQMADYIDGGMLARNTAKVTIDFAVYNPNFEAYIFTWIRISFQFSSVGPVRVDHEENTLQLQDISSQGSSDVSFHDMMYVVLLISLLTSEFRSAFGHGWGFWRESANCARTLTYVVNLYFLVSYIFYRSYENYFEAALAQWEQSFNFPMASFQAQIEKYQNVNVSAGLAALLSWSMVVQFLTGMNAVSVLTRAMSQSFQPSCFMAIIMFTFYAAFAGGAHIWFGRIVMSFATFWSSAMTWAHMALGRSEKFEELARHFPLIGFFCLVAFSMSLVFLMPMFHSSLIIGAYNDFKAVAANEIQHKERRVRRLLERERHTRNSKNPLFKRARLMWRNMYQKYIALQLKEMRAVGARMRSTKPVSNRPGRYFTIFVVYAMAFQYLAYLILQPLAGVRMRDTVVEAVKTPTFEVLRDRSGLVDRRSFDDIESWEDVQYFLSQVLPKIMFNSSTGGVYGGENPLSTYAQQWGGSERQLVLNDWNILVGQQPVRITARFVKRAPVSPLLVDIGMVSPHHLVKEAVPYPAEGMSVDFSGHEADDLDEIVNPRTKEFLGRHCNYTSNLEALSKDSRNGWACMLSVDSLDTMAILGDIQSNGVIGPQTGELVVDFVTYNGNVAMFLHAAIRFVFRPSGVVDSEIDTALIKLHGNSGFRVREVLKLCLEIFVFIMTLGYLAQSVSHFVQVVGQHHMDDDADVGFFYKVVSVMRATLLYVFLQPLEHWTLSSSICVIVTLVCHSVNLRFSPLAKFRFRETPFWDEGICEAEGTAWCSDEDVLFYMGRASLLVKLLSLTCGFTVISFPVRALGLLREIPRFGVVWRAMVHTGFKDIGCLLLTIVFLFEGFVFFGHHVLGPKVAEFQTLTRSHFFCFEMFTSTFNFEAIERLPVSWALLYFFPFMFIFRLKLYSLFLAIVDRSVRVEEEVLDEWLQKQTGADGTTELSSWERLQKTLLFNPMCDSDVAAEPEGGLLSLLGDPAADKLQEQEEALETQESESMAEHVLGGSDSLGWLFDAQAEPTSGEVAADVLGRISRASVRISRAHDTAEVDYSPSAPLSPSTSPGGFSRRRRTKTVNSEDHSAAFVAIQESATVVELNHRAQVLGDRSVHRISYDIIPDSHAWHLLPATVKSWALHLSQDIDAYISVACSGRTPHKELVPSELDGVLQKGELLIKSRAIQQSAKLDHATRRGTGAILQRLTDLQHEQEHFAWYTMIREKEIRKLQKLRDQSATERAQFIDAAQNLVVGPLARGGPTGPAGDASAPPGSLSEVPEASRPDPSNWKAAAVRAVLRDGDQAT